MVRWLVALEVGLALVLVIGAGLLGRSLNGLSHAQPGFDAQSVLTFAVPMPDHGDEAGPARAAFATRLVEGLATVPGVVSAGTVRRLPVTGSGWTSRLSIDGMSEVPGLTEVVHRESGSGYFETMRVPIIAGRLFEDTDDATSPLVVVINETLARHFPDGDPIGRRIAFTQEPTEGTRWWTVIGVVGSERQRGLRAEPMPEVFAHYLQDTPGEFRFVVRTASTPERFVERVRTVLRETDPTLPLDDVATMETVVAESLWNERFLFVVTFAFGLFAMILAALGVYGVTAQVYQSRTREFGIRLALGSPRWAVLALVLAGASKLVTVGLAVGVLGALATTRVLGGILYGVSPMDPVTFGTISALLGVIGIGAAFVPAFKATRVDPVAALRE